MNKNALLMIVAGLALAAAAVTMMAPKAGRLEPVDLSATADDKATVPEVVERASRLPDLTMECGKADISDLWERTLFNPERQEDEETAAMENAVEQQMNADFELAGIAMIGQADSAEPVAIIRAREKSNSRNAAVARRQSRKVTPGKASTQNKKAANAKNAKEAKPKTVYRKGEVVANTGYTLTSINLAEKMVELSRGRDTIKLYIEYRSEASEQRRKDAVSQENALRSKRAENARAGLSSVPQTLNIEPVAEAAKVDAPQPVQPVQQNQAQADVKAGSAAVPQDQPRRVERIGDDKAATSGENLEAARRPQFNEDNPDAPPPPPSDPRRSGRRNQKN